MFFIDRIITYYNVFEGKSTSKKSNISNIFFIINWIFCSKHSEVNFERFSDFENFLPFKLACISWKLSIKTSFLPIYILKYLKKLIIILHLIYRSPSLKRYGSYLFGLRNYRNYFGDFSFFFTLFFCSSSRFSCYIRIIFHKNIVNIYVFIKDIEFINYFKPFLSFFSAIMHNLWKHIFSGFTFYFLQSYQLLSNHHFSLYTRKYIYCNNNNTKNGMKTHISLVFQKYSSRIWYQKYNNCQSYYITLL